MTFHIVRSAESYKYHVFNSDDVIKHGMSKAVILANLDKATAVYPNNELHKGFPYIECKEFYKLLNELIRDGLLICNTETKERIENVEIMLNE